MTETKIRFLLWQMLADRADGLALDNETDRLSLVDVLFDWLLSEGLIECEEEDGE